MKIFKKFINKTDEGIQVGGLFHIHVADAGAGGDAGNGGGTDAGVDEAGAASGDQQVDIAVGRHHGRGP